MCPSEVWKLLRILVQSQKFHLNSVFFSVLANGFFLPLGVWRTGFFELNGDFLRRRRHFCSKIHQKYTNWWFWCQFCWFSLELRATFTVLNSSRPRKIWCRSMTPFQSTGFFSRWGFRPTGDSWNEREISRVQREIKNTAWHLWSWQRCIKTTILSSSLGGNSFIYTVAYYICVKIQS